MSASHADAASTPILRARAQAAASQSSPSSSSASSAPLAAGSMTALQATAGRFGLSLAAVNTVQALSSGALAGAVSRTITSPLERLKVMKQVQARSDKYSGIVSALATMYREEGLRSYWKGNGTNVVRIAPFSAIQFCSFDLYKRRLLPSSSAAGTGTGSQAQVQLSPLRTFAAGALTGITASTLCYPLDLVRSVLSVQTTTREYRGIGHALLTIARRDGVLGLYKGLTPTLLGIAPYIALNMTVFDLLKRRYLPQPHEPNFTAINLTLGACAGFVAAATTYPSDVVRRRLQLQGMRGVGLELPRYSGTVDCVRVMLREEGVRGLYKGLSACLLKVVPSMAISFTVYEALKSALKFDPPSNKPPSAG